MNACPHCGNIYDRPEDDATDGAHPAWWRGHDYTAARFDELVAGLNAELQDLQEKLAEAARLRVESEVKHAYRVKELEARIEEMSKGQWVNGKKVEGINPDEGWMTPNVKIPKDYPGDW